MMTHRDHRPYQRFAFSPNPDFDFVIRAALGHSVFGAAEPGEVLAATIGIRPHDHDAWFESWHALAQRTADSARTAASAGHRESASAAFLRASAYFGTAVNALSGLESGEQATPAPDLSTVFDAQQQAWEGFVDHTAHDVERIDVPNEDAPLPGYLFRASDETRPTLVAVNGSDGSLASLWADSVAPALRRGYHAFVFDGPGQQSQLFSAGTVFRPDWEHVLTPVYDVLARRPEIDAGRIALYGVSQGAFWTARALAFEHRFAGAIVDPGVVDVSASWTSQLPESLLHLLDADRDGDFDRKMSLGLKLSPATARTWRFRARPYGAAGFAATIRAVRTYTVADIAHQITTPLLILSPEAEQFWPGQAEQLHQLTAAVSTLVAFTAEQGADGHCQPLARAQTAQRVFDWLDVQLSR